jgi:L-alanine-DL-glutamate epimerase-like enolase superfamily enzyme
MRLRIIELYRVDVAFCSPVLTAAGAHRLRPVAFVRVVAEEAEGWGECAALAGGTAVDPAFDAVLDALEESGVGRLLAVAVARDGELPPASQVPALFGSGPVAHFVAATLEMAVLDAELRACGAPLWTRLGVDEAVATAGVPVGHLVGIPEDRSVDALVARVGELVRSARTARVRVKIEPGWDIEPMRALRDAFPGLALQADANGSYRWEVAGGGGLHAGRGRAGADRVGADRAGAERVGADRTGADRVGADRTGADRVGADRAGADRVGADRTGADGVLVDGGRAGGALVGRVKGLDDARRLVELDGLGLCCIEQPLPPADLAALAELAACLDTPVALDESLSSLGRVRDALRYGACGVACLKPARLGGLLRAKTAVNACRESGVAAFVGGFFESGFARAANAALAGLSGFTLPGDLSDPAEYLANPGRVAVYPGLHGALVRPFGGPGVAPPPSLGKVDLVRSWKAR